MTPGKLVMSRSRGPVENLTAEFVGVVAVICVPFIRTCS